MRKVHLLVGIPSMSSWNALMAQSYSLMMLHLANADPRFQHTYAWHNARGSILPQLRQNIVDRALKEGATHLLFIDSDQTFPHMIANEWIAEDRPVIAANIATKSMPSNPTARQKGTGTGVPTYCDVAPERFQKVWRVGTGVMMLRRDVLEALPRPAFTPYWSVEADSYVFEDWVLCEHIERAGFPIVVDNEMSKQIGHCGDFEFDYTHVAMSRRVRAKQEFDEKRKEAA